MYIPGTVCSTLMTCLLGMLCIYFIFSVIFCSMNLVDKLNPSVFLVFLKDWIVLEDICSLDGAYCNHKLRSLFLQKRSFQSKELVVAGTKNHYLTYKALKWMELRRYSVDVVYMHNSSFPAKDFNVDSIIPARNHVKTLVISNITRNYVKQLNVFLATCVCLTDLSLTHSKYVNDVSIEIVAKSNPSLTTVDFTGLIHITSRSLEALAASCPRITSFNVSECNGIKENVLSCYLERNKNLKSLNLSSSPFMCRFEATVANKIAAHCKSLHTLNLSRAWNVNVAEMKCILQNCTELTDLNIYACHGLISSSAINNIASHCKDLMRLNIGVHHLRGGMYPSVEGISDSAMVHFVKSCTKVTDLDISNITHMFTTDTLLEVVNTLQLQRVVFKEAFLHRNRNDSPVLFILLLAAFSTVTKMDLTNNEIEGVPKRNVQHSFACTTTVYNNSKPKVFHTHRIVSIGSDCSDSFELCYQWCVSDVLKRFGVRLTDLCAQLNVDALSSLTELNLSDDVFALTSDCLSVMAEKCTNLTECSLSSCQQDMIDGLIALLTANTSLTALRINNSNHRVNAVSPDFYQQLPQIVPDLRSLTVLASLGLTSYAASEIVMRCKRLRYLSVSGFAVPGGVGDVYRSIVRSGNKHLLENFTYGGTCSGDNLEYLAKKYPVDEVTTPQKDVNNHFGCTIM